MLALTRPAAADLKPDELALVVNSNEPAGAELAAFYAAQRHVPDNRILVLDLPKGDDITPKQYAEQVVPQVRDFLHSGGLETKVKCLVTFYGVPLRIDARQATPAEQAESRQLTAQLAELPPKMRPAIEDLEKLARRLDPTFTPTTGQDLSELLKRWQVAVAAVSAQLPTVPDPARQAAVAREFFAAAGPMLGTAGTLKVRELDLGLHPDRKAIDGPPLQADAAAYNRARNDAGTCEATPEDPAARDRLRKIARDQFGLAQYARLLVDQLQYLDPRHGSAAFDSELSLVQWRVHPYNYVGGDPFLSTPAGTPNRPQWFANPLYYHDAMGPRPSATPTMMVTRLDAPTPALVKALIATGVRVEEKGLRGKIVVDSLGAVPGREADNRRGYGPYDQTLRNLRDILAKGSQADKPLDVLFDANDAVLPPGSASNVSVYVGWYAVNGYVPSCTFAGGAVAMHVASYTTTTLHPTGDPNWAAGLLNAGVAATIGPVAEPYLTAFPRADDFFPLLLTGKLTLAECYWRTEAIASWQMVCIGDPLYTPFKAAPALTVADLPLRLRGLFPNATPTTKP